MQAVKRLVAEVARSGTRSMGYTSNASQIVGKTHGSGTGDKIGLFVMLPVSAGFIGYDIMYPEEEFEGKIPHYPYLHIRTRAKYPWGNDVGPFEHHRECARGRRDVDAAAARRVFVLPMHAWPLMVSGSLACRCHKFRAVGAAASANTAAAARAPQPPRAAASSDTETAGCPTSQTLRTRPAQQQTSRNPS
jgi:hypothetical protein